MGTFHSVCGSPSTRGAEDARSNAFPFLIPSGDTIFMRQLSCRIWKFVCQVHAENASCKDFMCQFRAEDISLVTWVGGNGSSSTK
jgi:hypothetical protein